MVLFHSLTWKQMNLLQYVTGLCRQTVRSVQADNTHLGYCIWGLRGRLFKCCLVLMHTESNGTFAPLQRMTTFRDTHCSDVWPPGLQHRHTAYNSTSLIEGLGLVCTSMGSSTLPLLYFLPSASTLSNTLSQRSHKLLQQHPPRAMRLTREDKHMHACIHTHSNMLAHTWMIT